MNRFSDSDKERMLSYPILSLLAVHGKRTDRRGPLFFSPFRDERTGSFSIDTRRNLWYDHGEGRGGNVFGLAQRLLGIPDSRRHEVWDYLASLGPYTAVTPTTAEAPARRGTITIDRVSGHFPPYMTRYASSRGIGKGLLERYCRAVTYHAGDGGRRITAIGFPAGTDGWTLRRAADGTARGTLKRCTSCRPTFLDPGGRPTVSPSSGEVVVFEGFFDFLSWLAENGTGTPGADVCVLNSVSSTRAALPFITGHASITTWLDNDRAGRDHTAVIRDAAAASGCTFTDRSPEMEPFKDLNERLMSTLKTNQIKP